MVIKEHVTSDTVWLTDWSSVAQGKHDIAQHLVTVGLGLHMWSMTIVKTKGVTRHIMSVCFVWYAALTVAWVFSGPS